MMEPKIQNVISSVDLACKINLPYVASKAMNTEYNPRRFAALIMRIREPKTTALIFASGKMVCVGAKSEILSKLAARKFARIVQKFNPDAKFKNFKINNFVASADVQFLIQLEQLQVAHHRFATYEPELFPGLIYRMKDPNVCMLIFVSGKIVITGAKAREDTYRAFQNIYPVLSTQFRKFVRG